MFNEIENRQILALANQGGTAAEIAKALDIEEAGVRLVLAAHEKGSVEDRDINDEQLERLRKHAYNLAVGAEDEVVQARLTMFLLERDKPSDRKSSNNITSINQALILANDSFKKLVDSYS